MKLSDVEALLRRHQRVSFLAALLLVFAGVDLVLSPSHLQGSEFLGIPFLIVGLVLFALLFRRVPGAPAAEARGTLASRFLHFITLDGRLVRWLSAFPILLSGLDLAYNQLMLAGLCVGTVDGVLHLFAAALLAD